MPVNLVSEEDLRACLRPHRASPDAFEAAVRERLVIAEQLRASDPFADLSPLSRAAASLMPWQFLAAGKLNAATVPMVPTGIIYKVLGGLAFPAICLFLFAGVTFLSLAKIRRVQVSSAMSGGTHGDLKDLSAWWSKNQPGVWGVLAVTLILQLIGATSLLFLLYLISVGILLRVLSSLSRLGLANRLIVSQACGTGLMFLFQAALVPVLFDHDIRYVDQSVVAAVFVIGSLLILPQGRQLLSGERITRTPKWVFIALLLQWGMVLGAWCLDPLLTSPWALSVVILFELIVLVWANLGPMPDHPAANVIRRGIYGGSILFVSMPAIVLWIDLCLIPVTPAQIKRHVESFDDAPYLSASWHQWEVAARWTVDSGLNPDMSRPRRLLAGELAGSQDPFVLGVAFRLGLVQAGEISQLKNYDLYLRPLLTDAGEILSIEQMDWVIRAAALRQDLSTANKDHLETRLNRTIERLSPDSARVLSSAIIATELLDVIGRPVDRDRHRSRIHDWLREFHTRRGVAQLAGGFATYRTPTHALVWWTNDAGALDSTSQAVRLMEIYGVPDGLDLDWVRSYLRTKAFRPGEEKWMAPVTLNRLNSLPGIPSQDWFRILYHERGLLAALMLVAMCLYAVYVAPDPRNEESTDLRNAKS